MIVTKEKRNLVYAYLFREGVLVAKKDFFAPKHHLISEVTNRELICLMKSLHSRSYVKETFNWGWYYWYLTPEGITYLRTYLNLPETVVPNTLKKAANEVEHERNPFRPRRTERSKPEGASGDFNPKFNRGSGRGRRGGFRGRRDGAPRAPRGERAPAPESQ